MRPSLWRVLVAAFNFRPAALPMPPNWLFLAGVGLAGFLQPAIWLIGAGLELAYLYALASNARFRAVVAAPDVAAQVEDWAAKRAELLARLDARGRRAQEELEARCAGVAALLPPESLGQERSEGLARLAWLHLRLLAAQRALGEVAAAGSDDGPAIAARLADLERRQAAAAASTDESSLDLSRALNGQIEVLRSRQTGQREAAQKLAIVEAEIERLRQQVELVREQALLASDGADPAAAGRSLDALSATLNHAGEWMRTERALLGGDDVFTAAPPPTWTTAARGAPARSTVRT